MQVGGPWVGRRAVEAVIVGLTLLIGGGTARAQQVDPPAPPTDLTTTSATPQRVAAGPTEQKDEPKGEPKGEEKGEAKGGGDEAEEKPSLSITGFAQLDTIYDFERVDPDWVGAFRPSKILVHNVLPNGETTFSVRQSRLSFQGLAPTAVGDIKARFEFDLFGVGADAGQTTIRIRHIYGELKRFLAGQTNSVFMDVDVFPNVIDYWGPAGMVFFRNPQLRYTPISRNGHTVAVSIEAPGSAVDPGNSEEIDPTLGFRGRNAMPDFAAHYRQDGTWGHWQIAGILRNLAFEAATSPTGRPAKGLTGGGVNLSLVHRVVKNDRIYAQAVYGTAISSYMNDGGVDIAPNSAVHAATVPTLGYEAYYEHPWGKKWVSSIGYSEHLQENLGGQLGDAFQAGRYFSTNLLYSPVPFLLMGGEFLWGQRENKDGSTGSDNRIQVSFKYNFSN